MSRDWSRRSAFGAKADRDRKLEQALKHELRAATTPPSPKGFHLRQGSGGQVGGASPDREGCVDAETLGAWADGGLGAAQMASVELHVSTCARCQAIVGATARSTPVVAVVESPFRLWKWWLAPIAATAAAVTIWMVVPEERQIAVVPPPAAAPVARPPTAAPARETFAQSKDQAVAPEAPPAAFAENKLDAQRERGNVAPPARQDRDQQRAEERVADALGATAAASAAPAVVAEPTLQKSARLAFAPIEIVSPSPSSRWRIAGGALERSEDSGTIWIPLVAVGDAVTGGTAPTASICWLIGRAGLVMVTADGVTFARVPLPERVDLTAITATDARSATVTAADGRQFRTDDSGRNWRQN